MIWVFHGFELVAIKVLTKRSDKMTNKVQKMRKFTEDEIATVLRVAEGFYIKDRLRYLNTRKC